MRKYADLILAAGLVALVVLTVALFVPPVHGIKPAQAQPIFTTLPTPNVYFYTAVTTAQQIIGQNLTRRQLQICNSGGTNPLWIMPNVPTINTGAIVAPATNVGVPVPAVASNVQSCFSPPAGVSTTQPWQGFSTTTPVTVLEYL